LGLRKDLRLRRRADFDLVYERGRIFNDPLLVLRVMPNELPHNRYGFVVSKRVGGAVVRNRVRRRLQEIVRLGEGSRVEGQGFDLLLSCKAAAATAKYGELEAAVQRLFLKGGLIQEEAGS
jgi:ribonuclease P protein component